MTRVRRRCAPLTAQIPWLPTVEEEIAAGGMPHLYRSKLAQFGVRHAVRAVPGTTPLRRAIEIARSDEARWWDLNPQATR